MPVCLGPKCNKIHPLSGFKVSSVINWPTRALREPNEREGFLTKMWFK